MTETDEEYQRRAEAEARFNSDSHAECSGVLRGQAWTRANPPPEVQRLIGALRMLVGFEPFPGLEPHRASEALAAYDAAVKGGRE